MIFRLSTFLFILTEIFVSDCGIVTKTQVDPQVVQAQPVFEADRVVDVGPTDGAELHARMQGAADEALTLIDKAKRFSENAEMERRIQGQIREKRQAADSGNPDKLPVMNEVKDSTNNKNNEGGQIPVAEAVKESSNPISSKNNDPSKNTLDKAPVPEAVKEAPSDKGDKMANDLTRLMALSHLPVAEAVKYIPTGGEPSPAVNPVAEAVRELLEAKGNPKPELSAPQALNPVAEAVREPLEAKGNPKLELSAAQALNPVAEAVRESEVQINPKSKGPTAQDLNPTAEAVKDSSAIKKNDPAALNPVAEAVKGSMEGGSLILNRGKEDRLLTAVDNVPSLEAVKDSADRIIPKVNEAKGSEVENSAPAADAVKAEEKPSAEAKEATIAKNDAASNNPIAEPVKALPKKRRRRIKHPYKGGETKRLPEKDVVAEPVKGGSDYVQDSLVSIDTKESLAIKDMPMPDTDRVAAEEEIEIESSNLGVKREIENVPPSEKVQAEDLEDQEDYSSQINSSPGILQVGSIARTKAEKSPAMDSVKEDYDGDYSYDYSQDYKDSKKDDKDSKKDDKDSKKDDKDSKKDAKGSKKDGKGPKKDDDDDEDAGGDPLSPQKIDKMIEFMNKLNKQFASILSAWDGKGGDEKGKAKGGKNSKGEMGKSKGKGGGKGKAKDDKKTEGKAPKGKGKEKGKAKGMKEEKDYSDYEESDYNDYNEE